MLELSLKSKNCKIKVNIITLNKGVVKPKIDVFIFKVCVIRSTICVISSKSKYYKTQSKCLV